jgi:predicted dehydrogenase
MAEKLRIGIIGYGYTGKQHARAVARLDDVEVTAIAEADAGRRAEAEAPAYERYQDLLQQSGMDAVTVCLPHSLHAEVASAALLAGKHVLVEKPLAMSVAEGERLCALAGKTDRRLMVEMTHRFLPPMVEGRRILAEGGVGQILAIEDIIVEDFGLFGALPGWMFQSALAGGGFGLTSGIHMVDHLAWLTGEPLKLDCANFGYSQKLGDVEDTAAFSLRLQSGAPARVLVCMRAEGAGLEGRIDIYGRKGTLRIEPWRGWRLEAQGRVSEKVIFESTVTVPDRALTGMVGAMAEFVASIREARRPDPAPEESLVAQRIIEQAYARSGAGF